MDFQKTLDTLNNLDPDNIGSWPILIKIVIWLGACALAGFLVYQLKLSDSLLELAKTKEEEIKLIQEFEAKAYKAANLDKLKKQMEEMEISFGALIRQLPSDTEVPGLLEDISQLGIDSGLEFDSINLQPEQVAEFYAVLPIQITVRGAYHSLGSFVSGMAALPRIVTLHDFSIKPEDDTGLLTMSITARTYRYNEET